MIDIRLFEAVMGLEKGTYTYNNETFNYIQYGNEKTTINDFFFKCIDFVNDKGYVFIQDTRGYSCIKHMSSGKLKIWDDEEYNKQRLFDACQWILENR